MFGESESESPRTGSPWDSLLSQSDPASPTVEAAVTKSPRVVPQLVPEVEEGNIEYKLRLLNPSSERFTRLVTQLKWRLLEGGGQAYYELGVADSGQLIGLSRAHLEQSLQTLEEMAGEIGASVIVVKEIELPAAMVGAAAAATTAAAAGAGAADSQQRGRITMHMRKARVVDFIEVSATDTGEETELSSPEELDENDKDDDEEGAVTSIPPLSPDYSDSDDGGMFTADLEIASVYKPRPHRQRTRTPINVYTPAPRLYTTSSLDTLSLNELPARSAPRDIPLSSVRKVANREKKEHQRVPKAQAPPQLAVNIGLNDASTRSDTVGTRTHMKALDELERAAAVLSLNDAVDITVAPPSPLELGYGNYVNTSDVMYKGHLIPDDVTMRRFIVEALVVRKMSLDEVFLDFVNL
ncbi:hypothetical protein EW145_g3714 [Phellinidium pouzarii]|uniref:Uncharacterized protein n=1 Tax=Phellinidium pouzarii TaxID=167371 RepID=A0A4S4L814_9AGAM|nr:hypothetical protein EW145_g3714 [Phellinidium pouzarii]